jgi:hypothetical protein
MFHDKEFVEDVILLIVLCIAFVAFMALAESASLSQRDDGTIDISLRRGD